MAGKAQAYDLFLDESGSFRETDRGNADTRRFPSQVAGVLVQAGGLDEAGAEAILHRVFGAIGCKLPQVIHGTELLSTPTLVNERAGWPERRRAYGRFIDALTEACRDTGVTPLRLVNREGVPYEDRSAGQIAMTCELALRLAETLDPTGGGQVSLTLHVATASVAGPNGRRSIIQPASYAAALARLVGIGTARLGVQTLGWRIRLGSLAQASTSWRLQLADLFSHASHDDFSPLDAPYAGRLRAALGRHDFTVAVPWVIAHAERCLDLGAWGTAIHAIAERTVTVPTSPTFRAGAKRVTTRAVAALISAQAPERDNHLREVLLWLERLLRTHRHVDLQLCLQATQHIEAEVARPLCAGLSEVRKDEVSWFYAALAAWRLTVCNHAGRIEKGAEARADFLRHLPATARRWDHSALLLGGFVALANYAIDCRRHGEAWRQAAMVADFYSTIGSLFGEALPQVFPARIASDLRGKALGTQLQACLAGGFTQPDDAADARRLSDEALAEFEGTSDLARQKQLRSQLETAVGDWTSALTWLADAVGAAETTHTAVASAIVAMPEERRGFPLLHWLRLGRGVTVATAQHEREAFEVAFAVSGLAADPWLAGTHDMFPTHAILRCEAERRAGAGRESDAFRALNRLEALQSTRGSVPLTLITVAAQTAVAGLLWRRPGSKAQALLDGRKGGNVQKTLAQLPDLSGFLEIADFVLRLRQAIDRALAVGGDAESIQRQLLAVAAEVVV